MILRTKYTGARQNELQRLRPDQAAGEAWIFGRHRTLDYYVHMRYSLGNGETSPG